MAVSHVRLGVAIDHNRLFTCPSLAPLAQVELFEELSGPQQRYYNQLVGLMQNEIICLFEQEFAARALPALLCPRNRLPGDLQEALAQFLADEREHTKMFRSLNRLAASEWYGASDYHILQLPAAFLALLRQITSRPRMFPMVFWVMLMMEERSLMISRRYARMDPEVLEPQFAATYQAHLEDEVRHVQLDWHLLERFFERRPKWQRRLNARLLEAFVVGLFLKPRRANVRLVDLLIEKFPALMPRRRMLVAAVHGLGDSPGYRRMMYSPDATPISDMLFSSLPELRRVRMRLFAH